MMLGEILDYRADIVTRSGAVLVDTIEPQTISKIDWGRTLNGRSTASVVCGKLSPTMGSAIHTYGHALRLHRGTDLVWEGPMVQVRHSASTLTISARDVCEWCDVTPAPAGTASGSVSRIAETLIRTSTVNVDDVVRYLHVEDSDAYLDTVTWDADSGTVLAELDDLVAAGLDYTTIGRRLILWGADRTRPRLPDLDDAQLLGEFEVLEDGLSLATHVTTTGKDDLAATIGQGDPFYGTIIRTAGGSTSLETQDAVNAAAAAARRARYPAPVILQADSGMRLAPSTPVGINDLLPGVLVNVTSAATGREMRAQMRLTEVSVGVASGAETVTISLVPTGGIDGDS